MPNTPLSDCFDILDYLRPNELWLGKTNYHISVKRH